MNFSEAVKTAMAANKFSTADVARLSGRSHQYISDLLKGDRRWNEELINEVCEVLGIKIEIVSDKVDQ